MGRLRMVFRLMVRIPGLKGGQLHCTMPDEKEEKQRCPSFPFLVRMFPAHVKPGILSPPPPRRPCRLQYRFRLAWISERLPSDPGAFYGAPIGRAGTSPPTPGYRPPCPATVARAPGQSPPPPRPPVARRLGAVSPGKGEGGHR